jgi:hypothetical protein
LGFKYSLQTSLYWHGFPHHSSTDNQFCFSTYSHTHKTLFIFSKKASQLLTQFIFTFNAALALMLPLILSAFLVIK